MTVKSIEVTRDWSDSRRKPTKQRILVYTYKDNVASEPKTVLV